MSSTALQRIVAEIPVGWWTRRRLEALVRRARSRKWHYTFEGLLAKAAPIPPEALAYFLAKLVDKGLVKRVIRVESPATRGGLGDYEAIEDIPWEVIDDTVQPEKEVAVAPGNVQVVYIFGDRGPDD